MYSLTQATRRWPHAVKPPSPFQSNARTLAPAPCGVTHRRQRCVNAAATSRREAALSLGAAAATLALSLAFRAGADGGEGVLAALQAEAANAFAAQDFATAEAALSKLVRCTWRHGVNTLRADALRPPQIHLEPANVSWLEGRAQVRVDAKRFEAAIGDFNEALALLPVSERDDSGAAARLRAGRALAFEGVSRWADALADYDAALAAASRGGFKPDPYILNSKGNVLSSLQRWDEARQAYSESAAIFQSSAGYRRGASTTSRLDGAIYAASNAALMRAQLGDDAGAAADVAAVARRAPNSADARAAQAALLWALGKPEQAEEAWEVR